jgi:meso-butanediol dehydrogenase / (S,S)-butanediol dehydrogenase / diacetyl reductase
MAQLSGGIALVTAGGGGIGQATAILLAERGAQVIAADIDAAGLKETARNCAAPERLRTVIADATTLAGAQTAVHAAAEAFGGLNILVNVVGGSKPGKTVVEMSLEEWDGWVRLNLTATFLMCKAAIPAMAASGGGAIVNISSGAGVNGMKRNPAYVAAKGAIVSLTKALAIDHAEQKIRANCIAPGAILTPLMKRNRRQDEIDWMAGANLVGRIGLPHDIAAMVAFLCSDDGAFVNGELINVSGGQKTGI